ncbi:hypothetical protein CDEF62S_05019 [Castellaniella defragrans]
MDDYRDLLSELGLALRPLHKALLDLEAERFGLEPGSFRLLDGAAHHEGLAWLRELSGVMARIDEQAEDRTVPITVGQAAGVRRIVEGLVGPTAPVAPEFRARYLESLQRSVPAAAAHAVLRGVLSRFPQPDAGLASGADVETDKAPSRRADSA